MTRLLTLDEAAELLRVSEGTVRALARREGLPLIRVSPRRYLVPEEGLTEWLDGRVVSGAAGPSTRPSEATGESASRYPRLVQEGAAKSGSTGRRRPPAASSRPSSVVSLADSQRKKAG
jgi:excisionase family DNA binding protein